MNDLRDTPLFVAQSGAGRPLLCLDEIEAHGLRFVGRSRRSIISRDVPAGA